MQTHEIIIQARRYYARRGYAGLRELFDSLNTLEQAQAAEFYRSYPTSPADDKGKRFADAFMGFQDNPIPAHKGL